MRIGSLKEMFPFFDRVQDKQDASGSRKDDQNPDFQQQNKKEASVPVTNAEVEAAIDSFGKDENIQALGLQASLIKSGPFLKVQLKDGSGALVRQFTGEEFLQLREAAKKDSRSRGKILDQKL